MLGLLLSLGIFGGAAAKNAYNNAAMKKYTSSYDSNGNHHYCDNNMREYINGERIRNSGYTDSEGIYHRTEIGLNSGKTYTDYVCPSEQLKKKYDDEDREYYRKKGFPAYPAYNPRFKRKVTTEFNTGKVVAAVVWFHNIFTQEILSPWTGRADDVKIDAYDQIMMNFDRFVDYCWNERRNESK